MSQELSIFLNDIEVGKLRFESNRYEFEYLESYLLSDRPMPISLSLPLTADTYFSEELFPFFQGLLTEGWLKSIQEHTQHLDRDDLFSFLKYNGKDLVGAVTVRDAEETK